MSLVKTRMGQFQQGCRTNVMLHQQQIQIQSSRSPVLSAPPPGIMLQAPAQIKQFPRKQQGAQRDYSIEIVGLTRRSADRLRSIKGRNRCHLDILMPAQPPENVAKTAQRVAQITTQPNECSTPVRPCHSLGIRTQPENQNQRYPWITIEPRVRLMTEPCPCN